MTLFFDRMANWADAVNSGRKIHSVRKGLHGIKPGRTLTMVTGRFANRVTFAERVCVSTQPVEISNGSVTVGGAQIDPARFAANSGFQSTAEMFAYYGATSGYIIHWTDLRYP